MRYLDSDLDYSEPVVVSKIHNISYRYLYRDLTNGSIKEYGESFCFTYDDTCPTEATAGSIVRVSGGYQGAIDDGSPEIGWTAYKPDGDIISHTDELNDSYKWSGELSSEHPWSFTMPNYDVTVWEVCPGGMHAVSPPVIE